jgi:hypothetical protein
MTLRSVSTSSSDDESSDSDVRSSGPGSKPASSNLFRSLSTDQTKKTEGLELGAVDKLLVGIFVDHDEGGEDRPQLSSSTIVLLSLLSNNNNHDIIRPIESL